MARAVVRNYSGDARGGAWWLQHLGTPDSKVKSFPFCFVAFRLLLIFNDMRILVVNEENIGVIVGRWRES